MFGLDFEQFVYADDTNIDGFEVDFVKFEDLFVVELFDYFVVVEYFV